MRSVLLTVFLLSFELALCCPTGWTPAPAGANWTTKCYLVSEPVSSMRACAESCGPLGAPACLDTPAEEAFVRTNVTNVRGRAYWLGVSHSGARCVTNSNVTEVDDDRWLPGEPNDASDAYSCVHLYDMGRAAALCRYPEHDTYRCVCSYHSNRSAEYDLSALEDAAADYVAGLRAATAVAFVITFLASFVPLLLAFGAARVKRELRARRPQGAEQARRKSDTEMKLETQLAASRAASLSLRLRVSGSLFITGWVLGFLSFGLAGNNLDVSLACLPIFLSGCKKLLIAPGSTYSSRMWCVMEMFTWIQVGGNKDTTKVLPLGGIDFDGQIAKFDAGLAQCFLRKDKERLLAILEAAFGDLRTFNLAVKANISKGDRKSSISE